MAKIKSATDRTIAHAKAGDHTIEPNLILRVAKTGSRSWVFRYRSGNAVRQIGLGGYPARSLAEARLKADEMREALKLGRDPGEIIKPKPAQTFKTYALAYIDEHEAGWKNSKHRQQWRNTLDQYAYAHIGNKAVADITANHVHTVLLPLWATKTETAMRVRMRVEAVIDYAFTKEGIDRRNPARWKGNLDKLLPNPRKLAKAAGKRQSHPAPHWRDVPAIMAALRAKPDVTSALVLRFSILTAARSMEVRGMMWAEIDLEAADWTLPAERSKNGSAHRVPLSAEAVSILKMTAERKHPDAPELVFPGPTGKLLSDVAINKTLALAAKSASVDSHITAHGICRSSFRDWVAEETSFPDKVAEAALNHTNPNATEAAYLRTKFFDRRVELMAAWGGFCASRSHVVRLATVEAA